MHVCVNSAGLTRPGYIHFSLTVPGIQRVARKLGVDYAQAMVGWDYHGGSSHPVYGGWGDEWVGVWGRVGGGMGKGRWRYGEGWVEGGGKGGWGMGKDGMRKGGWVGWVGVWGGRVWL